MEFNSLFFLDFLALPIQNKKISTVQINEEEKKMGVVCIRERGKPLIKNKTEKKTHIS